MTAQKHYLGSSSTFLLKKLRDVMASQGAAAQLLPLIINLIGQDTKVQLCALYILKNQTILELFTASGPESQSASDSRFVVGEGLVGYVAASGLPLFISTPEQLNSLQTGTFIGIPLIKKGNVTGVLTLQHNTTFRVTDSDIDVYETCATFLAELVEAAGLEQLTRHKIIYVPGRLLGKKIVGGLGIGQVILHQPRIDIDQILAISPDQELVRLEQAITLTLAQYSPDKTHDHDDLVETYRFVLYDKRWLQHIKDAILEGLSAEAALYKVKHETKLRFKNLKNPDFQEKGIEFEEVANQIYYHLSGQEKLSQRKIPASTILVAKSMAMSELLDYDRSSLKGLIVEEASPNSHIAILAKSLDLPMISRLEGLFEFLKTDDLVIVDADQELVLIHPNDNALDRYREQINSKTDVQAFQGPATSLDGIHVPITINAGFQADLVDLRQNGIEGVGLYRSEIPFMLNTEFPTVDQQTQLYTSVFQQLGDLPIRFRTLDLGADKFTPYFTHKPEGLNPAMGWRSSRITLDKPMLLRQQLRALLTAGSNRRFSLMFPMITEIDEFIRIKKILDLELAQLTCPPPLDLQLGIMIEVPSLVFQLDQIFPLVDFVSIGTNDLFQFLYASDRNTAALDNRYDPLSPAFLTCIKQIVDKAAKYSKHVSICGEMAGNEIDALALIALGVHELSVAKSNVTKLKNMIHKVDIEKLSFFVFTLLKSPNHSIREKIRHYAQDHAILSL